MVIEHNIPAMNSYRFLGINNNAVADSLEKLSSGLRINKAADDAAGLAISEKMRNQIRGLEMAEQNAKNGISLIQTAEGALNETHSILSRMRELAVQSSNGTYDEGDRMMITQEFDELKSELNRIAESTHYNGIKLLDGSLSSSGVSASTGAGANTGTFIQATKAEFVIDASDAFGEAEKASYEYDLSGLTVKATEGTDVFDSLGSLGGIDGTAGEQVFEVGGYKFNYKVGGDGTAVAAGVIDFEDLDSLKTAFATASADAAAEWDFALSDEGVLSLTAKDAGVIGGGVAPTSAPADISFNTKLTAAGLAPATVAAEEVSAGRDAGPLPVTSSGGATAPTVPTVTKNLATNTDAHGVTAIDFTIGAWAGDTLNGKDISNFAFNGTGTATGYFSFEIDGTTYKSAANIDTTAFGGGADLNKAMTFTEDGGTNTISVAFTNGSAGTGAAALAGIVTNLGAGTLATINTDGVAGSGGAVAVQGVYSIGGKDFAYDTADGDADDLKFNTIDGLVAELEDAFGSEYTFAVNADKTITATAINAGSAKNGGATINLDDSDATDAVADSLAVKGSMGTDEFKANKTGANTISSALSDVLEFGNTGIVRGTGTEYRVSADKKAEFIATLDTADTSEAGILKSLGLSTQEYTLTNETGEDLVITAKATGVDPNEEKILLHSQQNYRSLLYKEKDGTDDYRNLTISVDANKVGDTKFIGNTVTINGRKYQFTGQSDKNEAGEYAKAGDKLDNGNYAIDIGALADEDDATYAAGISEAIVDAVNVVEADAFDVEGLEFAVVGKGMVNPNTTNPNIATFSIRVNSAGITGNNNAGGLVFQIGANGSEDQRISMSINAMDAASLGETSLDVEFAAVTGMTVADAAIGTVEDANKAIDILDGATQMVSAQRANLGALQNRLESTLNSLGVSIENLSSAESIIRDTDMAKQMMQFTQDNIKVQAAQAMLAQANSLPQGVLQLLR